MKLPKLRELWEAVKALVFGPYTSNFPKVKPNIPDGFRGKPRFYQEDCVGCLACEEVCPARAIDHVDDMNSRLRTLTHHQDTCIYCQQCEKACITGKGILLTKEYDIATYDRTSAVTRSQKELTICENCGKIVAPLDHLKFLAKKVGHLLFANPTLLLARHDELKLLEDDRPLNSPHKRGDHLKLVCPHCRAEIILKEQW